LDALHQNHHHHHLHHETPFSDGQGIGIKVTGDNGQIKRILPQDVHQQHHDDHQLHHQDLHRHGLHHTDFHHFDTVTPIPFGPTQSLLPLNHGLDPLLLNQNILFDHGGNPPQRRFSDFGATPAPPYGFPVTLGPHDPSTIFHGPNLPIGNVISNVHDFTDDRRRPLTREHFLIHNNPIDGPLIRPREPNNKVPFGFNFDGDDFSGPSGPTVISGVGDFRPPTNGHGEPVHSLYSNKESSGFLRPMSPRRTTIGEARPPSPFSQFIQTVTPVYHKSTPLPFVTTPSPLTFHKSTPRPSFEIQTFTVTPRPIVTPGLRPIFGPSARPPAAPAVFATTFSPIRPIVTTPAPPPSIILSTPRPPLRPALRPRPFPGRGSSRFKPPAHFGSHFISGSDYSTQYQSGEHLDHNRQVRPTVLTSYQNR